jgi:hypothetical protein
MVALALKGQFKEFIALYPTPQVIKTYTLEGGMRLIKPRFCTHSECDKTRHLQCNQARLAVGMFETGENNRVGTFVSWLNVKLCFLFEISFPS